MSAGRTSALIALIAVAALAASPSPAHAADGKLSLGLRANILGGTGEPVNDTLGFGLFGRYRLNDKWLVGFGLDIASDFDVERPEGFVGLTQEDAPEVIDASADAYTFMAWVERDYGSDSSKWSWFWTAGLGAASVSVDDATGPLEGGGSWEVSIDAGTEFVLSGSAGVRRRLGSSWSMELAFRLDQRFADWTVVETVSAATGTVDDYLVRGFTLGVLRTF